MCNSLDLLKKLVLIGEWGYSKNEESSHSLATDLLDDLLIVTCQDFQKETGIWVSQFRIPFLIIV